jgi:hypothetical protein
MGLALHYQVRREHNYKYARRCNWDGIERDHKTNPILSLVLACLNFPSFLLFSFPILVEILVFEYFLGETPKLCDSIIKQYTHRGYLARLERRKKWHGAGQQLARNQPTLYVSES